MSIAIKRASLATVSIIGAVITANWTFTRSMSIRVAPPSLSPARVFNDGGQVTGRVIGWNATNKTLTISGPNDTDATIQTTFDQAGQIAGVQLNQCIAFAGTSAGGGTLTIAKADVNGNFAHVGPDYMLAGSSFVGVAYSAATSTLFLLDAGANALIKAAYTPGNPPPTAWTTVATDQQFAPLGAIEDYGIVVDADGTSPTITILPFINHGGNNFHAYNARYTVTLSAGGPTFATFASDMPWAKAALTGPRLVAGQSSLTVTGEPNTTINVVRFDQGNSVIGSTTVDGAGDGSVTTVPLELGGVYAAQAVTATQEPSPPFLTPVLTWGTPDTLINGSRLDITTIGFGMTAYVGHAFFGPKCTISHTNPAAVVEASYPAVLVVGVPSDVMEINGRWFLAGAVSYPSTAEITSSDEIGFMHQRLPLPDDPNLGNGVVCFQWAVDVGGGDYRLSEIVGVIIRPSPLYPPRNAVLFSSGSSSSSMAKGPVTPCSPASWTPQKRASLMRWLLANKGKDSTLALMAITASLHKRK